MAKPLVVITRPIPGPGPGLLAKQCRLKQHTGSAPLSPAALKKFVKGADAILSVIPDHITGVVMDAAGPQLKLVANYAVGFDNIDLDAAKERDITVTNTPGVLTEAVAEHTFALLMAAARRVVEADAFTRTGKYKHWNPVGFLGPQVWGKTLGIVGLGRIGSWVGQIGYLGYGMKVIYYDVQRDEEFEMRYRATYHELPVLLKQADFITIHVPLLPSTRHLVGAPEFRLMKKNAIIVNTSRGPVIDERALVAALKSEQIAGAALDVFENEPRLASGLAKLSNVILTPHIASATDEARGAMSEIAAENILAVLAGRPPKTPVV